MKRKFNKSSSSSGLTNTSIGCLVVFFLPFFAAGMFVFLMGCKKLLEGSADTTEPLIMIAFGLLFCAFPGGLLYMAYRAKKKSDKSAMLSRIYVDQPWLWREDWASGRILSQEKTSIFVIWFFCIFWNTVSIPAAVLGIPKIIKEGNLFGLIIIIFPLIGAGLLCWAIYVTLRWKKYGQSIFEPSTMPGVIGGHLQGQIYAKLNRSHGVKLSATLACLNIVTSGSGDDRKTTEHVKWDDTIEIPMEFMSTGMRGGIVVPVDFLIPRHLPQTDESNSNNRLVWRLKATADVPGIDYSSTFEVPVFVTKESDSPEAKIQAEQAQAKMLAEGPPPDLRVQITNTMSGGIQFYCPPSRNISMTFGLLLFLTIFSGALVFMIKAGIPIIFPIVFGIFLVLMLLVLLGIWTGNSHLVIENSMVRVRSSFLGIPSKTKEFQCHEISDITPQVGMQSGNKPFYKIKIHITGGKSADFASGIPSSNTVDWLIAKIKDEIAKQSR